MHVHLLLLRFCTGASYHIGHHATNNNVEENGGGGLTVIIDVTS